MSPPSASGRWVSNEFKWETGRDSTTTTPDYYHYYYYTARHGQGNGKIEQDRKNEKTREKNTGLHYFPHTSNTNPEIQRWKNAQLPLSYAQKKWEMRERSWKNGTAPPTNPYTFTRWSHTGSWTGKLVKFVFDATQDRTRRKKFDP